MSEHQSFRERLNRNKYRLMAGVLAGLALAGCGANDSEARSPAPATPTESSEAAPSSTMINGEIPEPAAEASDVLETDTRTPEQITGDVQQTSVDLARNIVIRLANSEETQVDAELGSPDGIITTMADHDALSGPEFSASYSEGGEAPQGIVGQAIFEASVPTSTHGKVDRLLIALDVKQNNPLAQSDEALSIDLLEKALEEPDTLQLSMLSPLSYTNAELGSQQYGLAYNTTENRTVVFNETAGSGYAADGPVADEINNLAHTIMHRIDPSYEVPDRPKR